jgi:hypothetical protein
MGTDWDDDELLTALRQALRARAAVPSGFVEAARNAFAWHNIDAELAELTYDSGRDDELAASIRAEAASVRALTYRSVRLTIELEVGRDALLGQIVPAQAATVTVQPASGTGAGVRTDEIGCFAIRPIPASPFRLLFATAAGVETLTGWITL